MLGLLRFFFVYGLFIAAGIALGFCLHGPLFARGFVIGCVWIFLNPVIEDLAIPPFKVPDSAKHIEEKPKRTGLVDWEL